MASPQDRSSPMGLGDAVINAAARLPPQPMQPTPEVCHGMCEVILGSFVYSFVENPQALWGYFGVRLKQPRAHEVAKATRQLLSCRAFVSHAVEADERVRSALMAGAMVQMPEVEAYTFIVKTSLYPAHVIYEASQVALDGTVLKNAEGTSIAIMERVVSFLKTEQARVGARGLSDRMAKVETALKEPCVRCALGMVLIDHILGQPKLDLVFEALGKPEQGNMHTTVSSAVGKKGGLGKKGGCSGKDC